MRKIALIIPLLVCCMACSRDGLEYYQTGTEKTYPVTFGFASDLRTRLTGTPADGTINDIQLLVFDENGRIESYANESGSSASVYVTAGEKTVWAVGNGPDLSMVYDLDDMDDVQVTLASQAAGDLCMYATTECTVPLEDGLVLQANRVTSRIRLQNITHLIEDEPFRTSGLRIEQIFVTNTPKYSLFCDDAPTQWYNRCGYEPTNSHDALLFQGVGVDLDYGDSIDTEYRFYACQNPTTADTFASTFSARHTRLVVKTSCSGTTYYYPITLPVLEGNKSYDITNLEILSYGSDIPEFDLKWYPVKFSVSLSEWSTSSSDESLSGVYMIAFNGNTLENFAYTYSNEEVLHTNDTYPWLLMDISGLQIWSDGPSYYEEIIHSNETYPYVVMDVTGLASWTEGASSNTELLDPVSGLSLDTNSITLASIGETRQLTATVTTPNSSAQHNITWESDDTSVATVSSTGLVTAVADGVCHITASLSGYSDRCTVEVDLTE